LLGLLLVGCSSNEGHFVLAVHSGTGGGSYDGAQVIQVAANLPPAGKVFDRWTGDTAGLASAFDSRTRLTMPAADVTITATYEGEPPPGVFERHVISLADSSYSGNPFEVEVDATFTHTDSGDTLTMPGYYAGSDTWKVAFMATRTGPWTYLTSSDDPDLDGKTGTVHQGPLGHGGVFKADATYPKKWRMGSDGYVVPIALRMPLFQEPATQEEFEAAADFMAAHNIHMMETRLTEGYGTWDGRYDYIFEGDWRDHEFDLAVWDRMELRMDALAERGLGAHVMFYSDDEGTPGWGGQTDTEALVIRYTVARLSAYPVLMWNTGIDVAEFRSQADVDWFGERVRTLDAYDHPISSRVGGGSGSYVMQGQTYSSEGDRRAEIEVMLTRFADADVPVSMDDAWWENHGSRPGRDHTEQDIRRALWKCVAAGGVGALLRGGGDGGPINGRFLITHVQSDLESEDWLELVNPFVQEKLGATFGAMVPESSLVSNAYCIADPARTKILCLLIGENDTYEPGDGGDVTVKLGGLTGTYSTMWFDPRTGDETDLGDLDAGEDHTLTPPSKDDWVLYLDKN
jgi:hypothetical protein